MTKLSLFITNLFISIANHIICNKKKENPIMDRNHNVMSLCGSSSASTKTWISRSPLTAFIKKVSGFVSPRPKNSQTSSSSPQSKSYFYRDAEQQPDQDLHQYASDPCLSSYYSVFVARLTIMAMLAILIGLLTILTWHFTTIYTTKSINSLALGLRYELLQRPVLRMWGILNSTVEITTAQVKLSEYVIRRYDNPTSQAQQVELYQMMKDLTWVLFASRKALNTITINYRNGFVQAFHRDHRSNSTFYIYSDLTNYSISGDHYDTSKISSHQEWNEKAIHGNTSAIWYREPLDSITGEKIGKSRQIPPDDLINIAGLSQVPNGVASWHVVVSKYMDSPLLSAALPVWDQSNESIVAVVGVTTALYSVGRLMKELVELHSGHMYLTSREGYLLATSTNAPLLTNSTKGPKLRMANDSQDPVIRSGAEWLQKAYGNDYLLKNEIHVEKAKLDNQQYYIDSFFLNLKRLPMVGVILLPRKYFMGKIEERALKTLIILISASLCILVIGCISILILTNGVSKEMKLRAELISHLDARRRAEASSNYKSQFLANMSHELRTPMAAVIGLLDILIYDDCLSNDQHATVTQIRKCSTALLRLLNNILDLSKVESGKLVLEEAEFDLGRELEGLVDMFSVQCINHNMETVLDLSDDMPKLVRGDSARVIQIFTNLISNSIKFTTSGHIILRGWCEKINTSNNTTMLPLNQNGSRASSIMKLMQHCNHLKKSCKKQNNIILWFEVDDTGCGIDPSKWESVFESFEQADASTTRLHGGTGLGLCIVRTLVKEMGGDIKVVQKDGAGTCMQLYLLLNTPVEGTEQHCQLELREHDIIVLLALNGDIGRLTMSQWLRKKGIVTWEASEWNQLTQILSEHFQSVTVPRDVLITTSVPFKDKATIVQDKGYTIFIIVVDISLLDLSTDIWKEQLNYLDKYYGKAKFAWMLNHDTSNAIKMELRRKGHLVMVNKPLYKVKMVQILEEFIKEGNHDVGNASMNVVRPALAESVLPECLEIDVIHPDAASSYDSDKSETEIYDATKTFRNREKKIESINKPCSAIKNCLVELSQVYPKDDQSPTENLKYREKHYLPSSISKEHGTSYSIKAPHQRKTLEGLRILLAEDTPVLQRVATIMLEKLGAIVVVVGDGLQAVDALTCTFAEKEYRRESHVHDLATTYQTQIPDGPPFHLVIMDCQMPKMDGYEATKAIRKSEAGTGLHIPIVALTAHAMSSDEAKCLEVGMDAYLTKPIDCKLMVSTILSLTESNRLIS